MKNLYIDFDGVIYNSIEVSYKMAEKAGFKKGYEEFFAYFKTLDWCEILKKSHEQNNAFAAISKLMNKFNVFILSHVASLEEAEEKVKIIRKHNKEIPIIFVPKTISKTEIVNPKNSILVDDYPENLKQWEKAGGTSIRFDLDMDGKGFPVIDNLGDILKLFDNE